MMPSIAAISSTPGGRCRPTRTSVGDARIDQRVRVLIGKRIQLAVSQVTLAQMFDKRQRDGIRPARGVALE